MVSNGKAGGLGVSRFETRLLDPSRSTSRACDRRGKHGIFGKSRAPEIEANTRQVGPSFDVVIIVLSYRVHYYQILKREISGAHAVG